MDWIRFPIRMAFGGYYLLSLLCFGEGSKAAPNIIFILADDMGISDLSSYGHPTIKTPVLDSLAEEGMKFTNFYAGAPVCTPTRASSLTGRYPAAFGIRQPFGDRRGQYLDTSAVTIAEILRDRGYATAHIGKWHLGGLHKNDLENEDSDPGPRDHGFEDIFSMYEEPSRRGPFYKNGNDLLLYRDGPTQYQRNGEPAPNTERWLEDYKYDEAIRLMDKYHSEERPFYMQIWWEVPHSPWEVAPEPYASMYSDSRSDYHSLITWADAGIRRITDKLKELGIDSNTIIFFCSDNGPEKEESSTGDYRGKKWSVYEGGIRSPAIAFWPGNIPRGKISDVVASTNDLLPTFLGLVQSPPPEELKVDGLNLSEAFLGQDQKIERWPMIWSYGNRDAVREGDWKLIVEGKSAGELYNLNSDPGEKQNVLGTNGEIVTKLLGYWKNWKEDPGYYSKFFEVTDLHQNSGLGRLPAIGLSVFSQSIEIFLEKSSPGTIKFFGLNGQAIGPKIQKEFQAGMHQFPLSQFKLPPGISFVGLHTNYGAAIKMVHPIHYNVK